MDGIKLVVAEVFKRKEALPKQALYTCYMFSVVDATLWGITLPGQG